jgi:hypothetical protein
MNDKQIAQHSEECWMYWRKNSQERNIDLSKFTEIDIWFYAYHSGVELGKELQSREMLDSLAGWAAQVGPDHSAACNQMADVIKTRGKQ